MNKNYFLNLALVLVSLFAINANAQDTIRSVIISEVHNTHIARTYFELTNMGDETVNLNDFSFRRVAPTNTGLIVENDTLKETGSFTSHRLPDVDLAPGASWTFMNVRDYLTNGLPLHNVVYPSMADFVVHISETRPIESTDIAVPEWEVWGFDSIDTELNLGAFPGSGYLLEYHMSDSDSVVVDVVTLNFSEDFGTLDGTKADLAGIPDAHTTHIFVRKASITKGNTNWTLGKGTSLDDSEWIPIPFYQTQSTFTTFGSHGEYDISMQSDKMDINMTDTVITIPWGNARRGNDIIDRMTIGDGMSWYYTHNGVSEDSAYVRVCSGDILDVYAVGAEREFMSFEIAVTEPETSMNKIFPVSSRNAAGNWGNPRFDVTDDVPGMDSILNVSFAERVDTLFKYLEKAPKANWEIVFVDGEDRIDLKFGDILKVTAENGAVKEYFISVNDYAPNDNSSLSAITWPDIPEYIPGWIEDTIPAFAPSKLNYVITLPYGTTNVPALFAKATNVNATITQKRATSVSGGLEDRTTRFLVTSESDTLSTEYAVIFEVEKNPKNIQHYYGEPFFSKLVTLAYSWKGGFQIKNPRDTELDLSKYMIVKSTASINPAEAIEAIIPTAPVEADHNDRYAFSYVPGYAYTTDTAAWLLEPGKLMVDPDTDPIVAPLGVFSVGSNTNRPVNAVDVNVTKWFSYASDPTLNGYGQNHVGQLKRNAEALMLFKILNDSILSGTKEVGDPADFELVDMIGDATLDGVWNIAGTAVAATYRGQIQRKPSAVKATTVPGEGFGTTPDSSNWIVSGYDGGAPNAFAIMGSHAMDIITMHLSTVASTVYIVSDGYSDSESIQGDLSGTTVEQFYTKIIKSDTGQVLSVISGSTGLELGNNDALATGDILKVVSADGSAETKYVLTNQALDSDANLTLINTSLGIVIDSEAKTITGVTYGQLLKDIVAAVKAPDLATMNVINTSNQLVPLKVLNYDTIFVDTKVGADIIFEVVAQDGVTKNSYKLMPEYAANEAFLISSIYDVDQDKGTVSNILYGVSTETLFDNIEVVKGASMKLFDVAGFERTTGTVHADDVIKVNSADGSVWKTYHLDFLNELDADWSDHTGVLDAKVDLDAKLSVFPIPANDRITIQIKGEDVDQFTFSLISLAGVRLHQEKVVGTTKDLDVRELTSGVYIVSANAKGVAYKKLIVIE